MSLDKELEAAYAAQEKRKKSLERSKQELEEVSAQGDQLASRSKVVILTVVGLCATLGSGVLIIDPESRPWGFLLLFFVLVSGCWSWYRNWRKT